MHWDSVIARTEMLLMAGESMKAIACLVCLVYAQLAAGEQCPQPCFCYPNFHPANTITVDCRSLDLYEVPFPVPNTTSHLDLSGNLIQFVREADFPRGLTSLLFLQLQNNDLLDIQPGAFRRVPNLQTISLYNNRLRQLRAGVFDGLTQLKVIQAYNLGLEEFEAGVFSSLHNIVEIDLSFNNVNRLPSLSFVNLTRLQRLSLSDNALVDIEALAVANLSSLTYLNLGYNQLMCITPRAFSRLPNLRTLVLTGNPIECGCCTVWLYEFLNRKNVLGPDCASPPDVRGLPLLSLGMDEICVLPTATIQGDKDMYVFQGTTLNLTCTGTGAPPPTFSWSVDGRSFDPSNARVTMMGGALMLSAVNMNDSGTYFCSAVSSAGMVASSVNVRVVPMPGDEEIVQSGTRGDAMLLDCAPGLDATNQIVWVYEMTPLTDSDKYSILDNGSLLVRDIDLEDMGIYTCLLGNISVNVSLVVQSVPVITGFSGGPCNDPTRLIVFSNEDNLLFCESFAIPPPNVTVMFTNVVGTTTIEAIPSDTMMGGTVRAEFQFLALPPPDFKLSGNFTCVAANEVGTVVQSVDVIVQRRAQNNSFITPGDAQVRFVGETAVLECNVSLVVSTAEVFEVQWMSQFGTSLNLDRIVFTQNNQTLIIANVTLADSQLYRCAIQAPSTGDTFILLYRLNVLERAMALPECATPTVTGLVGQSATLECPGTGTPTPRRQWFRDGIDVTSNQSPLRNRATLQLEGEQLVIVGLNATDSGVYTCTLMNIIADLPSNPNYTDTLDVILEVQQPPFFTYWPNDRIESTRGDTVQLWCGGRGIPAPRLTWWRRLNDSTVVEVKSDGRVLIADEALVFLNVMPKDEGVYYCNISSPLGTRLSNDAMLRVFVPPMLAPLQAEFIVLEGARNVMIDCFGTGDGDPPPVTNWLRNGQILPLLGEQAVLNNGTLVIFEVNRADAGSYLCRLANAGGMVYYNATLTVRTFPDTRVEPAMLIAAVGSQVTLFCSDGGEPPDEFKWRYNNDNLLPSTTVHIRSTGELILTNVQVENSGNYTCKIWGSPGSREATAILIVEDRLFASGAPSSPPFIATATPSSQTISLGDTIQLACLVDGFPEPEVTWLRNGIEQPNFSRVTIIPGSTLTIENARVTDQALYECVAENALGEERRTFNVTIRSQPQFTVRPQAQTLINGSTLLLECEAAGIPQPDITWLLNGTELLSNGRRIIDPDSKKLRVFNTTVAQDAGRYTCRAQNSAGTAEYGVLVTLQDALIPPNITSQQERTTLRLGELMALDCTSDGFPIPSLSWAHNGTILPSCTVELLNMRVVCVDDMVSGSVQAIILFATERDAGLYTCTAENPVGVAIYQVFLNIEAPTSLPQFWVYPAPQSVVNGSMITLDCLVRGKPAPLITWLKDFEPLNITADPRIELERNGTLVITDADVEDSGFYTCVADNGLGINQVSVTVEVVSDDLDIVQNKTVEEASPPVLLNTPIGALIVLPFATVTLDCFAVGTSPPTIIWFKDSQSLEQSLSPTINKLSNGSLVLTNITGNEEGAYRCLAVNSEGTAEAHVRVEITGGVARGDDDTPVISLAPQDQQVLSGSKVKMDCVSEGTPTPLVMWTRGDKLPVYQDSGISVQDNGSLLFESADMSHDGMYTCWAVSSGGVSKSRALLSVTPKRNPPFFEVRPTSELVVEAGGYFMLHCKAYSVGSVKTRLEWQRAGRVLRESDRVLIFPDGTLLVSHARVGEDAGSYSCVASNAHGNSTASSHVTVLRQPINSTLRAVEGTFVVLGCGPTIKGAWWRKDGAPVSSYDGQVWLFEVGVSDQGEYSCGVNSQVFNYLLIIQAPPTITTSSTLVHSKEGATTSLHCVAEGRPHPLVHWYHGDVEIPSPTLKYSPLNNGTLVIYEVTTLEGGAYTCKAENTAGKTQVVMLLLVTKDT